MSLQMEQSPSMRPILMTTTSVRQNKQQLQCPKHWTRHSASTLVHASIRSSSTKTTDRFTGKLTLRATMTRTSSSKFLPHSTNGRSHHEPVLHNHSVLHRSLSKNERTMHVADQ